ncbi:transcription factor UPBEAT protein [Perilla frutescens var. hirtella]|uniref:Transcription factor UPBEAT protein n=1 Tax=Perilla frutescens var. hirtella TaxID=608512 RepID=A0AAD4IYF5_PERFH|nr:transcription factor UPBEAT protein [Perilla frutescens var. hirtella]
MSPARSSRLKIRNSRYRNGVVVMKRRARLDRRVRPRNAVERKVRTLKKLIPNCESMGVERLFRETADYIMALQMRVKVMQIVVDAFSVSDDE